MIKKKVTHTKSSLKSFLVEAEFCDQEHNVVQKKKFQIYYFFKGH